MNKFCDKEHRGLTHGSSRYIFLQRERVKSAYCKRPFSISPLFGSYTLNNERSYRPLSVVHR